MEDLPQVGFKSYGSIAPYSCKHEWTNGLMDGEINEMRWHDMTWMNVGQLWTYTRHGSHGTWSNHSFSERAVERRKASEDTEDRIPDHLPRASWLFVIWIWSRRPRHIGSSEVIWKSMATLPFNWQDQKDLVYGLVWEKWGVLMQSRQNGTPIFSPAKDQRVKRSHWSLSHHFGLARLCSAVQAFYRRTSNYGFQPFLVSIGHKDDQENGCLFLRFSQSDSQLDQAIRRLWTPGRTRRWAESRCPGQ